MEISNNVCEQCTIWCNKSWTCEKYISFVTKEYKEGILSKDKCELWIADDDGEIEDDFPPCENNQIISKLGIKQFYLKIMKPNTDTSNSPSTPTTQTMQQNGTRGSVSKTSTALLSILNHF